MAIGAGSDEERPVGAGAVLAGQRPHVRFDAEFGRVGGQVERAAMQRARRHGGEQLVDAVNADGGQHFGAFGFGMGQVAHFVQPWGFFVR